MLKGLGQALAGVMTGGMVIAFAAICAAGIAFVGSVLYYAVF